MKEVCASASPGRPPKLANVSSLAELVSAENRTLTGTDRGWARDRNEIGWVESSKTTRPARGAIGRSADELKYAYESRADVARSCARDSRMPPGAGLDATETRGSGASFPAIESRAQTSGIPHRLFYRRAATTLHDSLARAAKAVVDVGSDRLQAQQPLILSWVYTASVARDLQYSDVSLTGGEREKRRREERRREERRREGGESRCSLADSKALKSALGTTHSIAAQTTKGALVRGGS